MLTDGQSVAIAAGATVNAFLGRPVEFLGVPCVMRLMLAADAAGVEAQLLINVGGTQLVPLAAGSSVNVSSAAGAGPKQDEDIVADSIAIPAGARLQLNLTNTGAASTNARYRAVVAP